MLLGRIFDLSFPEDRPTALKLAADDFVIPLLASGVKAVFVGRSLSGLLCSASSPDDRLAPLEMAADGGDGEGVGACPVKADGGGTSGISKS